jgi:hypothetical protein
VVEVQIDHHPEIPAIILLDFLDDGHGHRVLGRVDHPISLPER